MDDSIQDLVHENKENVSKIVISQQWIYAKNGVFWADLITKYYSMNSDGQGYACVDECNMETFNFY